MKKTIFLMAMLLTLSAAAPMASAAQQSHRNRPHTQMVDKKDKDATDILSVDDEISPIDTDET